MWNRLNLKELFVVALFILGISVSIIYSLPVYNFDDGIKLNLNDFYSCYNKYYSDLSTYSGEDLYFQDSLIKNHSISYVYTQDIIYKYRKLVDICKLSGCTVNEINSMHFDQIFFKAKNYIISEIQNRSHDFNYDNYLIFTFPKYSIEIDEETNSPYNVYVSHSDISSIQKKMVKGNYQSFDDCILSNKCISGYFSSISNLDSISKFNDFLNNRDVSDVIVSSECYYILVKMSESSKNYLYKHNYQRFFNDDFLDYMNAKNDVLIDISFSSKSCNNGKLNFGYSLAQSVVKIKAVYGKSYLDTLLKNVDKEDRNGFLTYLENLSTYLKSINYTKDSLSDLYKSFDN